MKKNLSRLVSHVITLALVCSLVFCGGAAGSVDRPQRQATNIDPAPAPAPVATPSPAPTHGPGQVRIGQATAGRSRGFS